VDNYKKYFHKAIRNNFPNRSGKLIASVNCYYERILPGISFVSSTPNPIDKRLDFSAYFVRQAYISRYRVQVPNTLYSREY